MPETKLGRKEVSEIRALFKEGYAENYISRRYGVYPNTIRNIIYDLRGAGRRNKSCLFTDKQVKQIRDLVILKGMPSKTVAQKFKYPERTVLDVVRGRTYRWVSGWIRPEMGRLVYHHAPMIESIRGITDQKPGAKKGTKREVKNGELIRVAKIFNVKPCTIRRWIVRGKLKISRGLVVTSGSLYVRKIEELLNIITADKNAAPLLGHLKKSIEKKLCA